MMTHSDVHEAVRAIVAGRGYPFVVQTTSTEQHPGRVDVEWTLTIILPGKPRILVRCRQAVDALRLLRTEVHDALGPTDLAIPAEIVAMGAPPETTP